MVYDYCLGRETFADFHDCRCVAEQFLDHRAEIAAQAPWHQPEKNSLIGMADDVADRCPNKPGVASYGYNQCTREFGVRLQDGVDAFCN